jgi:hypothetical protein
MAEVTSQHGAKGRASGTVPIASAENWAVASPESAGLDGSLLGALGKYLKSVASANTHGVLVVRHGTLVYEQYFAGEDEIWGEPTVRLGTTPNTICGRLPRV